jgi:hypothetical protein
VAYESVATIISNAVVELGIVVASQPATQQDVADPFTSTDQNVLQLLRLLEKLGRKLARHRNWSHLRKEYTFQTANGTNSYALPSDFRSLVPNSFWDRSTTWPIGGPVGSEYWQFRAAIPSGTINFAVRLWQGKLFFTPTPGSADTIAYEYQSESWVGVVGSTLPSQATKTAPSVATDVVFFDSDLMARGLVLEFRKAKGFDTFSEQGDYDEALYFAERDDSPAATIYLGGRAGQTPRKIDRWNIPDTGAGS